MATTQCESYSLCSALLLSFMNPSKSLLAFSVGWCWQVVCHRLWVVSVGFPHGLLAMFLVLMAMLGWTSIFFPLYDPGVSLEHVLPFLLGNQFLMSVSWPSKMHSIVDCEEFWF